MINISILELILLTIFGFPIICVVFSFIAYVFYISFKIAYEIIKDLF